MQKSVRNKKALKYDNDMAVQFSSVQSLSRVRLFATPWIAARQASLSITNSQNSLRLTSIKSVMPSSHLILGHPLLLLPQSLISVTQLCSILCDPMDYRAPNFPVHHQLPELAQTHAIKSTHPLSFPSPPDINLSQHQSHFLWVSSSHQVAEILELKLQDQFFQWICGTDFV